MKRAIFSLIVFGFSICVVTDIKNLLVYTLIVFILFFLIKLISYPVKNWVTSYKMNGQDILRLFFILQFCSCQYLLEMHIRLKHEDEFVDFCIRQTKNIDRPLDDIILETIVSPRNLCDYQYLQDSLVKINMLQQKINERENEKIQILDRLDNELSFYNLTKKSVFEQFTKDTENRRVFVNQYYCIQNDYILEFQNLLNFLIGIQGFYSQVDEKMIFETDEYVQKFKTYISRIGKFAKEKEKLFEQLASTCK